MAEMEIQHLERREDMRKEIALLRERNAELCLANALLRGVVYAARKMPRAVPKGGGASTMHSFQIAACDVWALDAALNLLDDT